MIPDLERRRLATEKTLARFRPKAFDWAKAATCIHLIRYHAINMGHKPPTVPRFRSALGAQRALQATGHDSLDALMDSMFPRIGAAFMLLGDVAMVPGDGEARGLDALLIASGGPQLLGWHDADPSRVVPVVGAMDSVTVAWRL